ncbi:MAG: thiamine phosphate synthase [Actinomycetota bacterium]|nr:thiamine phosphate synthase [Actinomycetota bacterium]
MATTLLEGPRGAPFPRLHLVTLAGPPEVVLASVDLALEGHAPLIQLRTKEGTDRERVELAAEVSIRCHREGVQCIVNDRADIAMAAGADGVHLGAHDLPVAAVRALVGPGLIVGATCRDPESARRAEAEGADYLGVGPAFATLTKTGLPEPLGPAGVAEVAAAVAVPVIAIGGVTAERVDVLLDGGAYGVAVAGAAFAAPDARAAVDVLMTAVEAWEWSAP